MSWFTCIPIAIVWLAIGLLVVRFVFRHDWEDLKERYYYALALLASLWPLVILYCVLLLVSLALLKIYALARKLSNPDVREIRIRIRIRKLTVKISRICFWMKN